MIQLSYGSHTGSIREVVEIIRVLYGSIWEIRELDVSIWVSGSI